MLTADLELASHKILDVGIGPGTVATPINLSTITDTVRLAQHDAVIPLGRMARHTPMITRTGRCARGCCRDDGHRSHRRQRPDLLG